MININKLLKDTKNGDLSPILALKAENPTFHWINLTYPQTGDTLGHLACKLGHSTLLEHLLSPMYAPNAVNCTNKVSTTLLHRAAQSSNHIIIKLLLQSGANVNALKSGDWTPLMLACTKKEVGIVQLLVQSHALVNLTNKDGWNCLHLAARTGSLEIVEFLIENGAETSKKTKNGRTCLHIAALHSHLPIIKLFSTKTRLKLNEADNCGNTPLCDAVIANSIPIVEFLIEMGADKAVYNQADLNLLHLAASQGHNEIIRLLIEKYQLDVRKTNKVGWSPLHIAARRGKTETLELLTAFGGSLEEKDSWDRSPSDYLGS